ncbi:NOC3L protein, partial [Amia calva]|nr:NOC3L protein [Amia calva]
MDVSLSSRNTFEVSRRQSAPDNLPEGLTLPADPTADQALKPKKLGISDFFSRSLFSRKAKEPRIPSQSAPGWKLFGKVPLRENPPKDSKTIQQEYEARTGKAANPPAQPGRRKNLEFEPLSTTALILEDRPANLPAKSTEEAQRHRQEYDEMVAEAKKREMKEAQKKKKIMKERYKQEEIIANAMVIWNTEILPNWETMRNTRKVRDLWWQGLPPSVRGKVWSLAIGNELNITPGKCLLYSVASLADRESSLDLIKLDISRTFPSLFIFQKGGPYHDLLHSVLGAYTCYRPDVGYVQGMSFIAAVLILNLEEADAFIAFANLLNKPCQMAFFRVDHDLMLKYFAAFEVFFEENLPRLFAHFQSYNLTPDLYLIDCEPVHAKKRKQDNVLGQYEKMPRKMQRLQEKEVIHLLPIKDKTGIIPQTMEKPVIKKEEDEEVEEETHSEEVEVLEAMPILSTQELLVLRRNKLEERKGRIAELGSAILSDPVNNIKKVKELRSMLMESDPHVAVTVRKLVMISLMEVFKDIVPSYRIRPLTEAEKGTKVKKETQQMREFEEGLVSQYKFYLENVEQTIKDWKQMKKKKSDTVSLKSYKGLAEVAVKCVCELLVALPHFNFHNNIIVVVVPLMNDNSKTVSQMCCEAVRKMLKQDKVGQASLGMVRVISGVVKSRNYDVKPEVLKALLCLRIKEVEVKRDVEDVAPKKKFMTFKEKRKNLSRMQRKWKKAEEKLEKELLEAEASESKDKKIKLHTETLNIVFLIYFRILKKAQKSVLLPTVLEGLAKFAHLINVEFFDDLLMVLHGLIESGDLNYRESLHCVQTAFNILSGQGDVLNIDPLKFYTHLYKTLFRLHAGSTNEDMLIVLQCLDTMLTKRRKQVTLQRALAFIKRLTTASMHTLPNSTIGILASNRVLMHTFPKSDILLDNESQGSGIYMPELDEPEYCNPQNTALWELHTLQRHYHPTVRKYAAHLLAGAPSEGSGALNMELSRK